MIGGAKTIPIHGKSGWSAGKNILKCEEPTAETMFPHPPILNSPIMVIVTEPIIKTILFIDNKKLAKLVNNKNNCDFYSTNWSFNKKILLNDMKKYE